MAQTIAVIPAGCPLGLNVPDCANARGHLYDSSRSSTWRRQGVSALSAQQNLGVYRTAEFGNDTLTLGAGTPAVVPDQVIAGVNALEFWEGQFGVGVLPANADASGPAQASALMALHQQGTIPSLSFGYTAGNQYRASIVCQTGVLTDVSPGSKGVLGSLTLGGYDAARLHSNSLSFSITANSTQPLVVGVQSIKTDFNGTSTTLLSSGIQASIDSTASEIWLPREACEAFERAFGLEWNDTAKIYPLNSSRHDALRAANPNVTFTIGRTAQGGDTVDIVLPYGAFDLAAQFPRWWTTQSIQYFPLHRAANASQYTLGRTFLQEAYLSVDWANSVFNVSQAAFPDNNAQTIVAISAPGATSTPDTSQPSSSSSNGQTIGLAVGLTLGLLALIGAAVGFFFYRRRKSRRSKPQEEMAIETKPSPNSSSPTQSSPTTARAPGVQQELNAGTDNAIYEAPGAQSEPLREMLGSTEHVNEMADPVPVQERHELPSGADGDQGPAQPAVVVMGSRKPSDGSGPGTTAPQASELQGTAKPEAQALDATGTEPMDTADLGHDPSPLLSAAGAGVSPPMDGRVSPLPPDHRTDDAAGAASRPLSVSVAPNQVSPETTAVGPGQISLESAAIDSGQISPASAAVESGQVSPDSAAADGSPTAAKATASGGLQASRPTLNRDISAISNLPSVSTPEPQPPQEVKSTSTTRA